MPSRLIRRGAPRAALLAMALAAFAVVPSAPAALAAVVPPITVTPIVTGLAIPWDVAFLPDGTMLFDERAGTLKVRLASGQVRQLQADLSDLYVAGESGLMGITVDPAFTTNRTIYTCQGYKKDAVQDVRVVKWTLDAGLTAATRTSVIVSGINNSGRHSGCRLRFDNSGLLFVATGDAARGTNPQDLTSLNGKVLRITTTGQPAPGNPFIGSSNANTRLIYTYGHRNVQGLSLRPGTNDMWSVEQGTDRDDEVNRLVAGANYGYDPVPGYNESVPMTDLVKYPAARPAIFTTGFPTLALSGGTWLSGSQWGGLNGTFVAAALKATTVRDLTISPQNTLQAVNALPELTGTYGRLRTVQQGPDGAMYVTTSNGSADQILRVTVRRSPGDPRCVGAPTSGTSPVALATNDSGVKAFVVGRDHSVYWRPVTGGAFARLGGAVKFGPSAVSWGGSRLDVFAIGTNGALYHRSAARPGAWTSWESLGGTLTSSPSAVSFSAGTLSVYARGADNALWIKRWTGAAWTPWASLGGALSSAPGAAVDPDSGAGQVGVRGSDGKIFTTAVQADGTSAGYVAAGYFACSAMTYAARSGDGTAFLAGYVASAGRAEVVDGNLISLGGLVTGSVALAAPSATGFVVVGRGGNGSLYVYDSRSGPGSWKSLGGAIL